MVNTLQGCICSESATKTWCCFSYSQDSWVQGSRRGNGKPPLTINPSAPLANFLLLVPRNLCPAGLVILVPKGNISARRYDSIELEVKTVACSLWAPHASEITGKEVTVLTGMIDPD